MKKNMNDAACPQCGGPLPGGALEGMCPACLMNHATETHTGGSASRFSPPSLEEIARLFPQLSVLELLGAGGMGAVYKARQRALDRVVALKILPASVAGGVNYTERFNREARALARLSHPNIVAVHEFGQAGGLNYFIMEFVDGANLRQLKQNARISPREALQIVPQICDALQYAHDEGVVHRDIKPENVLVDRKGRVKIADFGLAKILEPEPEAHRLTVEGQVMGTPHYMAPEQLERPLAVDHRADIYSLGVVFYELLTGDLPLGKFPPPSRKVAVDVRLDEVVLRALENDPARRYQSVSEVKSQLETIAEVPPVQSAAATEAKVAASRPEPIYIRWAGFPVVVERDGEREVSWEGAIKLVLTAMLLNALGLLLFRLVAGYHYPGSLSMTTLMTIFLVGAGLRRAMNAPTPPANPGPQKYYGLTWSHGALASLALLVLGWTLFQQFTLPKLARPLFGQRLSAQTGVKDPATGILSVNLPGSGRAEILAVGYGAPGPAGWWRPDGRRVENERFEVQNIAEAAMTGTTNRDLLTRVVDLPAGAGGVYYESEPSATIGSGGEVFFNGQHVEQVQPLRLALDPKAKTLTLRMGFGLAAWRTIVTRLANSSTTTSTSAPGDPNWRLMFHEVTETPTDGARVTLIQSKEHRNWKMRVVALDTNGVVHDYSSGSGTPAEGTMTWTYKFPGLRLAELKEFQIQVRPVHWVEFRNIKLFPNEPVPSPRVAVQPKTEERVVETRRDSSAGTVRESSL